MSPHSAEPVPERVKILKDEEIDLTEGGDRVQVPLFH
jgi:hypothetical protein